MPRNTGRLSRIHNVRFQKVRFGHSGNLWSSLKIRTAHLPAWSFKWKGGEEYQGRFKVCGGQKLGTSSAMV